MRGSKVLQAIGLAGSLLVALAVGGTASAEAAGSYVLSTTDHGSSYSPTFTGNGRIGVRVPATGQGYAGGTVPAQSELAGFYAQPPGGVQQRANTPTWSTLNFVDGGTPFSLSSGSISAWKQSINFHTGVITTTARWTAPNGHQTDLSYQVLTDRARQFVGLVRLTVTPHWSGTATVDDVIDSTPANLTTQVSKGWDDAAHRDWVSVQTEGTKISAALASQLGVSADVSPTFTHIDQSTDQSVGQEASFPVTDGKTYTFTKYVGVESSQNASDPTTAAQNQAAGAAAAGWGRLVAANDAAWAALWQARVDVLGNPTIATDVNASQFYLWSSTRAGVDWSISPAGLSSNGYDGHIFWDAETWMYPSLLALHSDLAAGMNAYRYQRLGAAEQHAADTGYQGARFPWESALDGTEQIPPPVSVNSEGVYEQHITADIALAQWQYYVATGDRHWLAQRGWPVLSEAARFWASRATLGAGGVYHINGVTGPDEENPDVNDEAYTNVGAKTVLADAVQAARVLGRSAPAKWSQIASKLVVLTDGANGIHPEFAGYGGQLVKQADVTLLQYPWDFPMSRRLAQDDINYYVPRTDPTGPSMSDAVNSIDTSALGSPGCASFVYTQRSYEPFIRDAFDQFSETKTGGAFTFMTGIGGFLQEFIYGYTGFRWRAGSIPLSPALNSGLGGVVVRNLGWHGRRLTISVGPRFTTVTLKSGPAVTISTASGAHRLATGRTLKVKTRRPDQTPTADTVRCGAAVASSAQPGAPALAAVDGSPATDWLPVSLPATLTAPVANGSRRLRTVTLLWGRQWPPAPAPNVHPPAGPVTTLRPTSYQLLVSADGHTWHVIRTVNRTSGTLDVLRFAATRARFVRVDITAASGSMVPMLEELTATG